jgi:hypothetical protein
MKTQTAPKLKLSAGRGRPRKVTQINRRLSISTADFKEAVAMMLNGKSLTKIERATSLNLKSLRAVRRYAIDNNIVPRKEGCSLGNLKRSAKKTLSMPTENLMEKIAVEKIAIETVKPETMANKTLTIDFKGIIMQVEIASIEVKGDTVVVR